LGWVTSGLLAADASNDRSNQLTSDQSYVRQDSSIELTVDQEGAPIQLPMKLQDFSDDFAPFLEPDINDEGEIFTDLRAGLQSVLVHLDPALDRPGVGAAPSAVRVGVRQFVAQRGVRIRYEYEILPNVINVRGLTPRDMDDLRNMPGVVRIEEDKIYQVYVHDSMPLIRGLESQKSAAGLSARGAGVRVCIIDTGINAAHSSFTGRIDAAADFDHYNNDADPADDHGHGSNVAGIAAGGDGFTVNFGTCGVEPFQGVAPSATIIAMKVCSAGGSCPTSDIVAGVNDCASTSLPGGQADVINMSLGGGQFSSPCDGDASAAAANNAVAAGVVVVAAAGNNGFANALGSPACGSQVFSVGAVYDSNFPNCQDPDTAFTWCLNQFCTSTCNDPAPVNADERICFSNRSSMLDISAPGGGIWAAGSTGTNSIIEMFGTSQASPHVAGLAALVLGLSPSSTPAQVTQFIRDGAIDLGTAGFDTNFGWGRIDVINTLNLVSPPTGCSSDPECSDGLFCNGAETCVATVCQPGTPPNCSDGVACTTDTCNEGTDSCDHTPNNGACSDGLFCNGAETCHITLGCQAGTPPNCNDSIACTADSCNEGTDTCDHVPNNALCSDGLFCNGNEVCNVGSGCADGPDPCTGTCDEVNDVCVGGADLWIVFTGNTTVPGVGTAANEDIVAYDTGSGTWSLIFDGSDVGLGGFAIDGMERLSNGNILFSFTAAGTVGGVVMDDSDVLEFAPTSLGSTTAGTFSMYFDGSDVGLTANSENVDAVGIASNGSLVVSSTGAFSGTGASGNDEDLFIFTATSLGTNTAGTFALHFDGSDVGLNTAADEDVDAAGFTSAGTILLSTLGNFAVTGVSGADEDILQFTPTSLGSTTSGTFSMFLDLSTVGISTAADVIACELVD